MSNFVYGFIEIDAKKLCVKAAIDEIVVRQPLGFREISIEELYGFSREHLPQDLQLTVPFEISDGKHTNVAQYLVDGVDYAPEADIGLPTQSKDRQDLLIRLIEAIFSVEGVNKISVTVNDSNQIEEVKVASFNNFRETILRDFALCSPPDVLYVVCKTLIGKNADERAGNQR